MRRHRVVVRRVPLPPQPYVPAYSRRKEEPVKAARWLGVALLVMWAFVGWSAGDKPTAFALLLVALILKP